MTFSVALALALAGMAAWAQTAPTAPAPAAGACIRLPRRRPARPLRPASATGVLHGHILDPTGALIPGAQVTVTTADGKQEVGTATANAAGGYPVRGLPAGSYVIQASYSGFATFVSAPIPLSAGQSKNIDIKMAIEAADVQVVVTDEGGPSVSTEAGANTSAIVLKGSDLDALSDDPDELSNEL